MRWDQRQVGACLNEVRERFIHGLAVGETLPMPLARDHQLAFVGAVTFPEDDQSHIVCEQPIEQRQKQIEPFLLGEA
jgi:hypothetical protein